jgi:hypothetical protein
MRIRLPLTVTTEAKQCRIARIAAEGPYLQNIMLLLAQPLCELAAGATVDQQPQAVLTRTASMLSSAIAARA